MQNLTFGKWFIYVKQSNDGRCFIAYGSKSRFAAHHATNPATSNIPVYFQIKNSEQEALNALVSELVALDEMHRGFVINLVFIGLELILLGVVIYIILFA